MTLPRLIEVPAAERIETAAAEIAIQSDVIILVLGRFEAAFVPQIRSICARALIPAALYSNALIVDDGDTRGLAGLMGQAARESDQQAALLGILAPGVEPDPNHTAMVRLPVEWGDYEKTSLLLAAELSRRKAATQEKPIAVVLFGGDETNKRMVLRCVRYGWPILVCRGVGGLGDLILNNAAINDPDMREILDAATIYSLDLDGTIDDFILTLLGPIQRPSDVLIDAWARYDDLDLAAIQKQSMHRGVLNAIVSLAVLGTFFAIIRSGTALGDIFTLPRVLQPIGRNSLHVLLILVPAALFTLISFNNRFREGNKWALLRGAAESIKREIFRYRMKSGWYNEEQCTQRSAPSKLAAAIKDITSGLVQSEVNRTSVSLLHGHDPSCLNTPHWLEAKNQHSALAGEQETITKTNYFIGNQLKSNKPWSEALTAMTTSRNLLASFLVGLGVATLVSCGSGSSVLSTSNLDQALIQATSTLASSSLRSTFPVNGKFQPNSNQSQYFSRSTFASRYAPLPMRFEPNHGESSRLFDFLSYGPGYRVLLNPTDSVISLLDFPLNERRRHSAFPKHGASDLTLSAAPSRRQKAHAVPRVVSLHLINSNRSAVSAPVHKLLSTSNYFVGNDKRRWDTDIPNYESVSYKEIYAVVRCLSFPRNGAGCEFRRRRVPFRLFAHCALHFRVAGTLSMRNLERGLVDNSR